MTVNLRSKEIVSTAFGNGSMHDFRLFKESEVALAPETLCLADSGYLGIDKLHANSRIPTKNSKLHRLTAEQKRANRELAKQRICCEHVIGRLKVFRILSERYRNRRKRFGLRFNLIAAIYNLELLPKS